MRRSKILVDSPIALLYVGKWMHWVTKQASKHCTKFSAWVLDFDWQAAPLSHFKSLPMIFSMLIDFVVCDFGFLLRFVGSGATCSCDSSTSSYSIARVALDWTDSMAWRFYLGLVKTNHKSKSHPNQMLGRIPNATKVTKSINIEKIIGSDITKHTFKKTALLVCEYFLYFCFSKTVLY